MRKRDPQRERRVALALLVRRHLLEYKDEIRASYVLRCAATQPNRRGVKISTALATLMDLPPYENKAKGILEPAKPLLDFVQNAGPAHFQKVFAYFRDDVVTPAYRGDAPFYIQMAIHEVFDACTSGEGANGSELAPSAELRKNPVLQEAWHQTRFSPSALVASIEETAPEIIKDMAIFDGTWNVIRHAYDGRGVVRLAMHVTYQEPGRALFKLYYRTHGTTAIESKNAYVTHGSLFILKRAQHVMFLGQEETHEGQHEPDGYPITILTPVRIPRDGPFIGLVQRRHEDGKISAIKAQFIRATDKLIDALLAEGRVGSFHEPEKIAQMASDIPGFEQLLSQLEQNADVVKGGVVL